MAVTEIHTKQRCVDAASSANHCTEMKRQMGERWLGITGIHELYIVIVRVTKGSILLTLFINNG
jgi:hypothetical protein